MERVNPVYMQQSELHKLKAKITKIGTSEINKKRYKWVQLSETIFHPKGGGQLSDCGTIQGVAVTYVHKEVFDKNFIDQFEILHCFPEDAVLDFKEGDEVSLAIDALVRQLHSRMHTAGHLLAATTNEIFPIFTPSHGNHDPNDGYVKFKIGSEIVVDAEELKSKVALHLMHKIAEDLPVIVTKAPSGLRAIQIGESVMPCGGTHVDSLRAIGAIMIRDIVHNKKENILTIKYVV